MQLPDCIQQRGGGDITRSSSVKRPTDSKCRVERASFRAMELTLGGIITCTLWRSEKRAMRKPLRLMAGKASEY